MPAPGQHFPQPGSLEYAAAGRALDRLAAQAADEQPESALGQRLASGMPVLGAEAVEAAKAGDAVARRIVEIWAERVGIGVANAINTFDPEEVVIGGGAARAGELLLEPAARSRSGTSVPGLRGRDEHPAGLARRARRRAGCGAAGGARTRGREPARGASPARAARSGESGDAGRPARGERNL